MLRKSEQLFKIGIVSVPFSKGNARNGSEEGPKAILQSGLIENLKDFDANPNLDIQNYGAVKYSQKILSKKLPINIPNYADYVGCIEEVSKTVRRVIEDNRICITLGGDHSVAAGTLDGHLKAKDDNVSVLWVDAHCDINTPKTSHSCLLQGMPLSLMVKELSSYWSGFPGIDWRTPNLQAKHIAYIGSRSVDDFERLIIEKLGITAFGMESIDELGIQEVIRRALRTVDPQENRSLHISFDIDALDPLEAPATILPIGGGLTLREGIQVIEAAFKTGRLGAFDLCEVNPKAGNERELEKTLDAAMNLIRAATGHKRSGTAPLNVTEIPT